MPEIDASVILDDLKEHVLKGHLDGLIYKRIEQAINRRDGSFIYRIELTGGSTPTASLKQLDGQIINGVKIRVP